MGRVQTFETATAVAAARDLFWDRGYEATSVADLEDATGVQRSSLYHAFGSKRGLFDAVLAHTPESQARSRIELAATTPFEQPTESGVRWADGKSRTVPFDVWLSQVTRQLGNGSNISCQDTVPFCLWAAARHLDDYQSGIVNTIRVGGDIDTNCAIVGGIVALACGLDGIPRQWRRDREELAV